MTNKALTCFKIRSSSFISLSLFLFKADNYNINVALIFKRGEVKTNVDIEELDR